MAGLIRNRSILFNRVIPIIRRFVSTSNKKCETATVETIKSEVKNESQKNWVSYGFEYKDKKADRAAMNGVFFVSVTLCLVVGGFSLAYTPDFGLIDWAQREAYLELARREKNGLLPIDPNFIDPNKVVLPSDEELGDTEIII